MKNKTKALIILSCALGATLSLALGACAVSETRESTLDRLVDEGINVVVYYEKNGGIFGSAENIDFFDAFRYDDVEDGGVKLIEPGDPARTGNNAANSTATRNGYFLVGWYRERIPRVNENGDPLDDEGNICSVRRPVLDAAGAPVLDEEGNVISESVSAAGKQQAYSYRGKWDFSEDRLTLSDLTPEAYEGEKTVQAIHLYAAWAPNFTYEFYRREEASGAWTCYATLTKPINSNSIAVPHWNDVSGSLDYGNLPRYRTEADEESGTPAQNYTLTGVYADPACLSPYADGDMLNIYESAIPHHGLTDLGTGTATDTAVKVYTTWKKGNWSRIKTAAQLASNASSDGCYEILADLDCSSVSWNFSNYTFTGTFKGNGHTLSNITSRQTDATSQRIHGGLFGQITSQAKFENITFENVSYTIEGGARPVRGTITEEANFGLFAGRIADGVTKENFVGVKVEGTVYAGGIDLIDNCNARADGGEITSFVLGTVAGNLIGDDLKAFLAESGLEIEVHAEAAVHNYSQDSSGNPYYGITLRIVEEEDESKALYGKIGVYTLETPIRIY